MRKNRVVHEQLSDLELEILELLSMNGETIGLLVEMLNYEDEETAPPERKVTEPEIRPILDDLRARGLVTSELGYSPDPDMDKLELVLWWDVTATGLAIAEALEEPDERAQSIPKIEIGRLLLRQWREEDLEPYARICADPEVMRYLPGVLTREESAKQIDRFVCHWREHGYGLWAVEEKADGEFIGFVGLAYQEDWPVGEHKVEVGWRLDRRFWGNGLATEGALASLSHGFENRKLERIISICDPRNRASQRVMEKCGLSFQGEAHWKGYDEVWYAIDRENWKANR